MGNARVSCNAAARLSSFEESGRACLALGLSGGGAGHLGVLARGALGVNGAGVGLGAVDRHNSFERSGCAHGTFGLGDGGSSFRGVLARRACSGDLTPLS